MYLAFLDESGDPGLRVINREYPVFALAAVVCLERDYVTRIDRQVKQFKASNLGTPNSRLSGRDIAKQRGPFATLVNRDRRRAFGQQLAELLTSLPITLIAAVLNKEMHRRVYGPSSRSAYAFTLPFLMERLVYLMTARHDGAALTVQSHGKRENTALMQVWHEHLGEGSYYHEATEFSSRLPKLDFRPASDNSSGLQLADLAASACGRFVLDPDQPNGIYTALAPKLYQGKFNEPDRFGLKIIP